MPEFVLSGLSGVAFAPDYGEQMNKMNFFFYLSIRK